MDKLEKKLEAYRTQEKRKRQVEIFKNTVLKPMKLYHPKSNSIPETSDNVENKEKVAEKTNCSYESINYKPTEPVLDEKPFSWRKFAMDLFVWSCFFRYAVYIEFGAVFILLSGFYLMWANTRTGPKNADEMSAYSVFNPNCERIEGSLDAEQFEKEIRYGLMF